MRERILIVFIAVAIGLLITTLIYFLYQQTKSLPTKVTNSLNPAERPTPTPAGAGYLVIDSPQDEMISDRRSIQIKGKTNPKNIIVVSTNQEDAVASPTSDGNFAVTISIDAGSNKIIVRSIAPNGEETMDTRVITYTTEDF